VANTDFFEISSENRAMKLSVGERRLQATGSNALMGGCSAMVSLSHSLRHIIENKSAFYDFKPTLVYVDRISFDRNQPIQIPAADF